MEKIIILILLSQIRSTPTVAGISNSAISYFNGPIQGIVPCINRSLVTSHTDKLTHDVLNKHLDKMAKSHEKCLLMLMNLILIGATVAFQG